MSLSHVAVEQREKEAKTLKSFLTFSLIGSLALHMGVLSLGINKFLSKAPELENEPLEIEIVELPTPPKSEPKPENKIKTNSVAGDNRAIPSNSGSNEAVGVISGGAASLPKEIATTEIIRVQPAPQQNSSQRISKATSPPRQNQEIKPEELPARKVVTQPKIVTPSQPVATKPVETPAQNQPAKIVTQPKPVTPLPVTKPSELGESDRSLQQNNQRLNNLLVEAKNTREQASNKITAQQSEIAANLRNQVESKVGTSNGLGNSTSNELRNNETGSGTGRGTGNGTGTGNETGNGRGRGTGSNTGNGTGNGTGTNNSGTGRGNNGQSGSTVATGTQNIQRQTSPEASDSNTNTGSSSGGLACRTCSKPKYPERARKRGLEGKAEISVDVDSKGNVTNVRLAQTSGHAELDKAAIEQARNWKFKTPNGATQGVTAKVDFAIEGSKKSRQNRERRRQRAAARKRSVASSQNTQTQAPTQTTNPTRTATGQNSNTSVRRSLSSTTNRRRRVDTLPPRQAFDRPQRQRRQQSVDQTSLRNSLKRSQTSTNQNRVRRSPAPASNQTKLRQSLRIYQQKSPTTPSTNSNEP